MSDCAAESYKLQLLHEARRRVVLNDDIHRPKEIVQ